MRHTVPMLALSGWLLLGSVPATAQSLKIPTIVFVAAAASDWTTTGFELSGGATEANPLLKRFHGAAAVVVAGSVIDLAGICAWRHFVSPHHPRIAAAGLYVGAAFRIALALHNLRTPNMLWK